MSNSMTVQQLIKKLEIFPEDRKVFLSIDEEGNGFGDIWCIQEEWFSPEEYEVYAEEDYEDYKDVLERVVILWQ